jgi:hypothetical protein
MTIEKALGHFGWKLDPKNNQWKPTGKDIEAYNFMCDYVEQKQREQLNNYLLFAKLYTYLFGEFLKYYKCSPLSNTPQKALNSILAKDLDFLVKNLTDDMNVQEMYLYCVESNLSGFMDKHPFQVTSKKKKEMVNALQESVTNDGGEGLLKPSWEYQDVEENLKVMINAAINQFS